VTPKAQVPPAAARPRPRWFFGTIGLLATLLLWLYFTIGFVVLAGPFYLWGVIFLRGRHHYFQALNYYFFRGFFLLCRLLTPMHTWNIDPAIRALQSSVVVCNHISFLDSILLISLFRRHSTIVKNRLFHIPILGWVLTLSGYLPASAAGRVADLLVERVGAIPGHLAAGGNLIVFPEGTRSRDGALGPFNTGAFKIAKYCQAPVAVLFVRNTEKLFAPGRFLFNICGASTITLELVERVAPAFDGDGFSLSGFTDQVRGRMESHALGCPGSVMEGPGKTGRHPARRRTQA
jgi:1-acyl-sn-glycerol-3-phosphate acyltransferase